MKGGQVSDYLKYDHDTTVTTVGAATIHDWSNSRRHDSRLVELKTTTGFEGVTIHDQDWFWTLIIFPV